MEKLKITGNLHKVAIRQAHLIGTMMEALI